MQRFSNFQSSEHAVPGGEDAKKHSANAVEQIGYNLVEGHLTFLP